MSTTFTVYGGMGANYAETTPTDMVVTVLESDVWPVDDASLSGTKDSLLTAALVYDGVHPVVAIGSRVSASGRGLNPVGIVVSVTPGLTLATSQVRVNITHGKIVRNWVANVTTYSGTAPATFITAPYPGQPVYVDDSAALGAGVTLSMSPLNTDGDINPLGGFLWYCQDELPDQVVGGARSAATFDVSLSESLVQQTYCIMLPGGGARNIAA